MIIDKNKTCIFVIDGKQAFFYHKVKNEKLIKIEQAFGNHVNPEEHHTKASLGRAFDSISAARHVIEPHIDERLKEKQKFVSKILGRLEKLFKNHIYNHLIIIAPPKVLGYIRAHLSKPVKEKVILEIDKDLIHQAPEHIQKEAFSNLGLSY